MRLLLILLFAGMLCSCEVKVNAPGASKNSPASKIRNGIDVSAKGVKVEQAFLTYDDGSLVDETNTTSVNKKLKINFVVKGWKVENDNVALEANEKITTSDGDVIMDEQELFSKGGLEAISAADAEYPRLSVVINQVNKLYDFYLVSFKIWNKGTDQSIEGKYKFHIN
jgi:hypothetical protein